MPAGTARFCIGRKTDRWPPSLDGHHPAEVVPLEEDVDVPEAGSQQKLPVLEKLVRNEDVLERLAFLRDLGLAVAVATLQVVVVSDEQAIEERVLGQDFLDENQTAVFVQARVDLRDEMVPVERADELQRQDHDCDRGVFELHAGIEIDALELEWSRKSALAELFATACEHLLGIVDADEPNACVYGWVELQERGP